MTVYAPYNKSFPSQQTRLLELWDEIGIPHKCSKQIFGFQLAVLGIEVDAVNLTFTLPKESKDCLSRKLSSWCVKGIRKTVREWQQLAGWVNWVFNVYPLLRPSLNNIYSKMRGMGQETRVWANMAIREDLKWVKNKLDGTDGIRLLKSLSWKINEATCVAKTDACLEGFAYWYPNLNQGFTTLTPKGTPPSRIIFYEALAVLSALYDASHCFPPDSRIIIYMDNSFTVAMFNSL